MNKNIVAKPFLKWAGGKTQLINEIKDELPSVVFSSKGFTFVEPFVGSGAVLFWMLNRFSNLKSAVINDINKDLTDCYKVIKYNVEDLIILLKDLEVKYHSFKNDLEARKSFYYAKRTLFNKRNLDELSQSALFIFLNKTCFNGLYRVNKKNEFNVPIGSYKQPKICDEENLLAVSKVLKRVVILNGDYSDTIDYAGKNSFFYFDPPYKPLSKTSSFNSYSDLDFNDSEQVRLKQFCKKLDSMNTKWVLSNSDMKNIDPEDNFFDYLYADFQIHRIYARRSINSKSIKRGEITELLITN
ncbi:modification methylase [bacterium DOLZORAL124_38_8]|nr:MAG: modification methylase [bacterium DOLZORAL124_38_8]